MMISSAGYIMLHEHDSYEELIREREKLTERIKELENLVFSDDKSSIEWMEHPDPVTQYYYMLNYLSELCVFMMKRYINNGAQITKTPNHIIEIRKVGITKLCLDAIVNSANDRLTECGGVCDDIFREAGFAELTKACNGIGGCMLGNAVITPGFKLPAKYIIHAVGPVWHGGNHKELKYLYSAYKQSLLIAKENGCHSIGFPLISTGIFGCLKGEAWRKAIQACMDFINNNSAYEMKIVFAVLDDEMNKIGQEVLEDLSK